MPREWDPDKRRERDDKIWRLYSAGNTNMDKLGQQFGITRAAVSNIIAKQRAKYRWHAAEKREELAAQLDRLRAEMSALVDAEPAPMFRGTEPVVDRDERGEIVKRYEDHSGRVAAAKALVDIQARQAKMLGLDAPDQLQTEATVKYTVEGIDVGDLT